MQITLSQVDSTGMNTLEFNPPTFEDACDLPTVKSHFVIRFTQGAKLYLELSEDVDINKLHLFKINAYSISPVSTSFTTKAVGPDNLLSTATVGLNNKYVIRTEDSCGNIIDIARFSTVRKNHSGIRVSYDMIKVLNLKENQTIFTAFYNNTSVSYAEKFNFIQEFYFDDATVNETHFTPGNFNSIRSIIPLIPPTTCNCEVVIANPYATPNGGFIYLKSRNKPSDYQNVNLNGFQYNGYLKSLDQSYSDYWESNNPNKGGYTHEWHFKGAMKHIINSANGHGQGSESSIFVYGGNGNSSPSFSNIGIIWLCENMYNQECLPECSKEVKIRGLYKTRLRTHMELPSCFLCGGKGGKSKSEDYAILMLADENGNSTVLDAGKGTVESTISSHYNTDWFVELTELVFTIASTLAGDLSGEISYDDLLNIFTDEILQELSDVITTNLKIVDGGETIDKTTSLVNNASSFYLSPNTLTFLSLYSLAYTNVYGYASWDGYAKISSDYVIALAFPEGIDKDDALNCCSDGISAWNSASFYPESPTPAYNYDWLLDNFFDYNYQLFYDHTPVGALWKVAPYCDGIGNGGGGIGNGGDRRILQKTPMTIRLYDITGRLIFKKNVTNGTIFRKVFNITPGIFIEQVIYSDNTFDSKKLFLNTEIYYNEYINK